MTILPSRMVQPMYGFTWNAATSNQTDDSDYTIRLNAAAAPPLNHPVSCRVSGTGVYDFDWKIDGGNLSGDVVTFPWRASGATQYQVPIRVNENLDASEHHILTLLNDVGAIQEHDVTCSLGATKPDATNTGHGGNANQNYTGTYGQKHSPLICDGQIFTNDFQLFPGATGSSFTNCWFKGDDSYGIRLVGAENVSFDHCEFGEDPYGGSLIKQCSIDMHGPGHHVTYCLFRGVGGDHIKVANIGIGSSNEALFENCYFTKLGLAANAHGDQIQANPGVIFTHGPRFYRCFFDWREVDANAAGGSTSSVWTNNSECDTPYMVWESCWIRGGHYTFRCVGPMLNSLVKNCHVGDKVTDRAYSLLTGAFTEHLLRSGNKEYTDLVPLTEFNNRPAF